MLAINNLLILAAGIAVNVIARTGVTEAHAYVGGRMIPDELTIAQAKASGLPLD
jgi:Mg2+/citrate symporter